MGAASKWGRHASHNPLVHDQAKLLFDVLSEDDMEHSNAQRSKVETLLHECDAQEMFESTENILPTVDSFAHAAKTKHDPDTPNH